MKKCRSVVEIGSSQGTVTEATSKATKTTTKSTTKTATTPRTANFREEDLFRRPNSRLSSIGSSPYKDSQLSLYTDGEFQEHYNSIMYSTNLVDSCVEALNDIAVDDNNSTYLLQSNENIFLSNRLASAAEKNAARKQDGHAISDDQVILFENWLNEMEKRVADYPTLSQIYAMEANEMRYQFRLHSNTFNEIVAQPCIVKNSKRDDHRDLEERYHLLYLRAYEVLLLLEGLPFNQTRHNIISDLESEQNDDDIDEELLHDDAFDLNDDQLYNEDNNNNDNELSLVQNDQSFEFDQCDDSSCNDKYIDRTEAPYDSDLVSLFDNMDEIYETIKHGEHEFGMQTSPDVVMADRVQCNMAETYDCRFSRIDNTHAIASHFERQDISVYEQHSTTTVHNTTNTTSNIVYNKVYNWLNSRTINESTYQSDSCNNFVYIYKAKSESNMGAAHRNRWRKYFSPSTSSAASLVCPTSADPTASMLYADHTVNMNEIIEDSQLDWDYLDLDLVSTMSDAPHSEIDEWSDYGMNLLEWALCFFGEDYGHYIAADSVSIGVPSEQMRSDEASHSMKTISDREAAASTATLHTFTTASTDGKKVTKRRRRRINKRIKKIRNTQTSVPAISSKTAMVINSATDSEGSAPNSRPSSPSPASSTKSSSASDPTKNIRYNSDDQSFEMFTDHADEPIKHKVNELKPEDFHDIIKMCRSNIDCVITVLGAEPNRILTVNYCQKMRYERQAAAAAAAATNTNASNAANTSISSVNMHNEMCCCYNQNNEAMIQQSFRNCNCMRYTCLCKWIAQTIAMIINFLLDCWNIFRNMRLYSYLGKVLQGFFASTKEVAKRIKSQRELTALTYTYC